MKTLFAGARGAGNQQVRHLRQVGGADAADQVFAKRHGELRGRMAEFGRFDDVAQGDCFAASIRNFDARRWIFRECARSGLIRRAGRGKGRRPGP